MNILTFGASSSSKSINQKFAIYAANQIDGAKVEVVDLNDFEMPIFSTDREESGGIPDKAKTFKSLLAAADGVIVSFAEHNGSYATAFKNVLDWISRLEGKIWLNKPMLLLSTSPGGRGGQTVLNQAALTFPHQGADVAGTFSFPFFQKNFSEEEGITDSDLNGVFQNELSGFVNHIKQQ
ncbi:NADPH-dependent FMN reductase [Roseivirga sp.]|uniref:NADPH-dependent FMN reductase n=1 Tax=Roseivirga sp. TaxID=1964215 RepID=UPI003B8E5B8D